TLTIDQEGQPRFTPLTESVQIRVFLEVPDVREGERGGRQAFFEFVLERSELSRGNDGLRNVGPAEPGFLFSHTMQGRSPPQTQMSSCIECHIGSGIHSMMSITPQHWESPSTQATKTTFRPQDLGVLA